MSNIYIGGYFNFKGGVSMSTGFDSSIIIFGLILLIALLIIQVVLSTRKNIVLGLIIPLIFLITVGYNIYIEFFIYNPHPTMKRGTYETLGIGGFLLSLIILLISRMIMRRYQK